jgi:dTDP-4-amino-4,6-dideoxygalactose transaminase
VRIPLIDLVRQHAAIAREVEAVVLEVLRSGVFLNGACLEQLERRLATYLGVGHAIGVQSGTSALFLALHALDLPRGGEVITTPMTFVATIEAIIQAGLTPRFVDIEPEGFVLDARRISAAIGPRTVAILPVHLHGQPADMDAIVDLARAHRLRVIEDNAQGFGGTFRGRCLGTIGDLGITSFFPGKVLGAPGDGGAIFTDDAPRAARLRTLRDHGRASDRYVTIEPGFNLRLGEIAAASLCVKLDHLPGWLERRRAIAGHYHERLADLPLTLPSRPGAGASVWQLFVIQTPERDRLRTALARAGIASGLHYPIPCHLQPAFAALGHAAGDFPNAERHARETLSLPIFPEMTDHEVDEIIGVVRSTLGRAGRSR